MSGLPGNQVRPTKRCLDDLGLSFPDVTQPLPQLDNPLIRRAQGVPAEVEAWGAERVVSLSDRTWFKCKVANQRGIVTRLTAAECQSLGLSPEDTWWAGAAGTRRADSASDFYKQIASEADREGKGTGKPSTGHLLPKDIDRKRLEVETATRAVQAVRNIVLTIIAKSLQDGHPYTAELNHHSITALVRAADTMDAYLAIAAEGFVNYKIIATILDSVPGIPKDDWQSEPGAGEGVGLTPGPGQMVWSTIIPPEVQADILARFDAINAKD